MEPARDSAEQALPALLLHSTTDAFPSIRTHLPPYQRVKIGRLTEPGTVYAIPPPSDSTSSGAILFDFATVSRKHAEVWAEDGKIFIRDTESSNGTFVNGERLSAEGEASRPVQLRTGDVVVCVLLCVLVWP
ncbi:SMAD/FHA domain-containing protein [Dentipellis sp. KUC8613]|nr:SMAD/FHA domain-containing protein [Dentipellis sp. KUC8613]